MNILRESMTKIETGPYYIRIWKQEADTYSPIDREDLGYAVIKEAARVAGINALALAIIKMPNVNAVEVLDLAGNGEVLYQSFEVKDSNGIKRQTI